MGIPTVIQPLTTAFKLISKKDVRPNRTPKLGYSFPVASETKNFIPANIGIFPYPGF